MVQFSVIQSRVGLLSLQIAAILCLFWGIAVYAQAPLEDRNGGVGRVVIGDCLAIAFLDSNHPSSQPMQAAVERAIENGWVIRQVNVRKEAYAAERYRVHTTPTVILLRGGREVDRILGAIPFDEFSQRLVRASSADSLKTLDGSKIGRAHV